MNGKIIRLAMLSIGICSLIEDIYGFIIYSHDFEVSELD